MAEILDALDSITLRTWAEYVAVALALAYVWLAARQNILCWPAALISTAIYIWVFWDVSLLFHTMLNVYYVLMAVYGWIKWKAPAAASLTISKKSAQFHLLWIIALLLISIVLSAFAHQFWDSDWVVLDAGVTVFSVFATVLVAHKVLETWLYWIVIDLAACLLCLSNQLYPTAALFAFYTLFAGYGYYKWRDAYRGQLVVG